MRIAHVLHPYQEDLGYQENHLPAKQRDLGHDVRIFTTNHLPNGKEYQKGEYIYNSVPTYRENSILEFDSVGEAIIKNLFKKLQEFSPGIIHAHGHMSLPTVQAFLYNYFHDCKLFVDVHVDNDNFHVDTNSKKIVYYIYKKFLIPIMEKQVKQFLPVNPFASDYLTKDLGIPDSKQTILPLGVDTNLFNNEVNGDTIRKQIGISKDDIVFSFVGNINPTKDIEVLIRSFGEKFESNDEAYLLIIGPCDEDYKRELLELTRLVGIERNVIFVGTVDHDKLPEYYNTTDIGVWPGKLGVSILEAMGCGVPIIVCNSRATDFLIDNNGVQFSRGNESQLSTAMWELYTDEELRQKYSDNSLDLVRDRLSWEKVAQDSISIYNN